MNLEPTTPPPTQATYQHPSLPQSAQRTQPTTPPQPTHPRRNSISLVVLVMEGTRSIEYMGGIILSVRGWEVGMVVGWCEVPSECEVSTDCEVPACEV